jgi:pimeloyl-ACP methyl ester carboxylesterase
MTKTILLIHGAWLNGHAWLPWKARFEAKGYTVLNPSWPYDERPPAELNASPDPKLKTLGQLQCIDHYDAIIRALPEKPIIMGHSLGGVFTQHLLDRGLGAVGVAIDPAPTPGVPLGPHAIVSALPVLGDPFSGGKAKVMSKTFFATRFAQALPKDMVDEHYKLIVPTPGKVYWDGISAKAGKINWSNPARPPLLLIAGSLDLIADASMTAAIYKQQKKAPSTTELKTFEGRSHWTCSEPGWEAVADFALDWAEKHAAA